jgi:hypothetical protein
MANNTNLKGRIKYDVQALAHLYTGVKLKARSADETQTIAPFFLEGDKLHVLSVDAEKGTVTAVSPIDPERVVIIATEAVELYNEALGVWQQIVAIAKKIGSFFKGLFGKDKRKP